MYNISIIIPVYNGEKHIENCYNSINDQNEKSLEIIFINDGSTDKSLHILNNIKNKDRRVIVIDQINQGVSQARNNGIKAATSNFVGFMDVDDLILPDFYSKLLNTISDNDIIVSNILLENEDKIIKKESFFKYNYTFDNQYCNESIISRLLCIEDLVLLPCWNKLYRRKFLIENNIFFDKKISLEEDGVFNCMAFSKCKSLMFIDYAGYIYKDNEVSVTRDFITNKTFEKTLNKYKQDYYKSVDVQFSEDELKRFRSSRFIFSVCFLIFKAIISKNLKLAEKKIYINGVLKNKDVVLASKNLHSTYINSMGKFEKIILNLIKSKSNLKTNFFITLLSYTLNPKIIYYLKKINK